MGTKRYCDRCNKDITDEPIDYIDLKIYKQGYAPFDVDVLYFMVCSSCREAIEKGKIWKY